VDAQCERVGHLPVIVRAAGPGTDHTSSILFFFFPVFRAGCIWWSRAGPGFIISPKPRLCRTGILDCCCGEPWGTRLPQLLALHSLRCVARPPLPVSPLSSSPPTSSTGQPQSVIYCLFFLLFFSLVPSIMEPGLYRGAAGAVFPELAASLWRMHLSSSSSSALLALLLPQLIAGNPRLHHNVRALPPLLHTIADTGRPCIATARRVRRAFFKNRWRNVALLF
jgi:hypothetical protein